MKGIIIYEKPWWDGVKGVTCCEFINEASYELKNNYGSQEFISYLKGEASKASKAKCSPEDTYDFETGALISLMKMCGREKVIKACDELYRDDNYKNALQEMTENNEKLMEENEKLQHDYNLCLNSENALKITTQMQNKSIEKLTKAIDGYKQDLYKVAKRCRELEAENEKLKLDCEMLQHGYNDMIYKPPTKREEMWENIFTLHKESDVIIKVKREDINAFLHEIENKIPEIRWASGVKIFEAKHTIKDIYKEIEICDTPYDVYFRLWKVNKLSYSGDQYIYPSYDFKRIYYLPPMRWDLFKKGRIIVAVKNMNELEEFRKEVERNTGIKDIPTFPTNFCLFYSFDKDNYKIILKTIEQSNIAKINGRKVYYWEDVR